MTSVPFASKPILAIVSAALIAAGAACGSGESKPAAAPPAPAASAPAPAAPTAAAPAAPAPAASENPAADSGEVAPAASASGLAADVPVYPGAVVSETASDANGPSVIFTTPDPSDRVADRYFADLRQSDWVVQQSRVDDGQALFAEKGTRSLAVMIQDRGDQGSEISVMEIDTSAENPEGGAPESPE